MTVAEKFKASAASKFLTHLAGKAMSGESDHYHSGGALPDILTDLKREGHISDDIYVSGCRLVHDLTRCHGNSAGLTAKYGDQIDGAKGERLPSFYTADIDAFNRVDDILSRLAHHERGTLAKCILSRESKRGTLADWGRQQSNYKTAKTARAFAIGQVKALLSTVHELYRSQPLRPPN